MINQVYNIDCNIFMKDKSDKFFDLCICDPPYFDKAGNDQFYHGCNSKSKNLSNSGKAKYWGIPKNEYYQELKRISKQQIIWGINYFNEFVKVPVGRIVWDKDNRNSSFSDCEIASCSLIKSVKYYKYTWDGFRQGKGCNSEKRIHRTQKPIALYKWLLQNYAKPGWKIFDSHVGSGSSRIACYDMGFDFDGCELDIDYFNAQEERFRAHIANKELFDKKEIQEYIYQEKELL